MGFNPFVLTASVTRPQTVLSFRLEHLASIVDLRVYLNEHGHAEACTQAYSCDPWKYEPILFDELLQARRYHKEEEEIHHLRELIRAGSWMTYPRLTEEEVLQNLRHLQPLRSHIQEWIVTGKVGAELEPVVRLVEEEDMRCWTKIKQLMSAHHIGWDQIKKRQEFRGIFHELELIRPVRDLLYFRRLYPSWARLTIH